MTVLKSSRSMKRIAMSAPRCARSNACFNRSENRLRLGSPVRESWNAWWASRRSLSSSARVRSVTRRSRSRASARFSCSDSTWRTIKAPTITNQLTMTTRSNLCEPLITAAQAAATIAMYGMMIANGCDAPSTRPVRSGAYRLCRPASAMSTNPKIQPTWTRWLPLSWPAKLRAANHIARTPPLKSQSPRGTRRSECRARIATYNSKVMMMMSLTG